MREDLSARLHRIATAAAREAGGYALAEFRKGVPAEEKSSFHDLVTAADREAEALIVERILRECPESTIVGEEGGSRGSGAISWYIDPIDGTNNFARGMPFFAISIAAALDGVLLAGAIYDPVREELFSASSDGAFLNGRPIVARGRASDERAILLTDFPQPRSHALPAEYERLARLITSFHAVRRMGCTTLMLAHVACGRADVVYGATSNPWDIAAGMLIIERAGGRYLAVGRAAGDERPAFLVPAYLGMCPEFDIERSVLREVVA